MIVKTIAIGKPIPRLVAFMLTMVAMTVTTSVGINAQTSSWKLIDFPQLVGINSIALSPSGAIFLGVNAGYVLVSTDNGSTWNLTNDSAFSGNGLSDIVSDSSGRLLIGTGVGFFVSSDAGADWTMRNNGLSFPSLGDFYALCIDSGYVIASTGTGLFRSSNEGVTWDKLIDGFDNSGEVANCFVKGSDGRLYAGTTGGVYFTTDQGDTWGALNSDLPIYYNNIRSLAFDSTGDMFAGSDSTVYKSTNFGASWVPLFTPKPYAYINALAFAKNGNFLVGTIRGFYLSTDKGGTWSYNPAPVDSPAWVSTYAFDKQGNIFAGTGTDGVFRSTDDGNSWVQLETGPSINQISSISSDGGGDVYAVAVGGGYYDPIICSTNEGGSWTLGAGLSDSSGIYPTIEAVASGKTGEVFAATNGEGLIVSTNRGKDWSHSASFPIATVFSLAADTDGFVYAGTDSGVYESTDEGATWHYIGLYGDDDILSLGLDSAGDVFAGTGHVGFGAPVGYARIFRFSNGGAWTLVYGNTHVANINAISAGQEGFVYAVTTPVFLGNIYNNSLMLRSTDGGMTWATEDSGLSQLGTNLVTLAVDTAGRVFAGDIANKGIYMSSNHGLSWTEDSAGLGTENFISAMTSTPSGKVYAGSNDGFIYELSNGEPVTSVLTHTSQVPEEFSLSQNYPNPFNPTTVISYKLSALSDVTLKVYDVLGRKVATLVNERQNAGSYSVTFDGSRLASGVYFYRLTAGSLISVKKLMLLK
jgi:photosystem II stability/assembly factor-like uncharacterized protein